MQIQRSRGGVLESKLYNATAEKPKKTTFVGKPFVVSSLPYRYVDRKITPEMLVDFYNVPIIFSSITFLNRLSFAGLDFILESIDGPEDDTKKTQIDQAMKQMKTIDKSLAQVAYKKNCNTLDCVRRAAIDVWSFNKSFYEKTYTQGEKNVYAPKIQHLQAQSFNKTPTALAGVVGRYHVDSILRGVIYDSQKNEPLYYQHSDSTKEPFQIDAAQMIFIEDGSIPDNTSLLHSVASTLEFMKQARHDFRLALSRIGTPKQVASFDATALAQLKTANIDIEGGYKTLVDHANNMVVNQSSNQAEVALPGEKYTYPNIPVPIDPMAVENFIEQIILNHFFARKITEQLAQAVSVSAAPGKALLDGVISGYQEVSGRPFIQLWQEFLDVNGYELIVDFDYWNWAPKDQAQEAQKINTIFAQGGFLINDYRAAHDLEPYTDEQLIQLYEEQNALKRGRMPGEQPGVPGMGGGFPGQGQPQQPQFGGEEGEGGEEELTEEELAAIEEQVRKERGGSPWG